MGKYENVKMILNHEYSKVIELIRIFTFSNLKIEKLVYVISPI